MKNQFLVILLGMSWGQQLWAQDPFPIYEKEKITVSNDWLVDPVNSKSGVYQTPEGYLVFSNGLVSRTFTVQPNVASVELEESSRNISYLRSVRPEASVTIDGHPFDVGGLIGQPVHNYLLKEWIPNLKADPGAFKMADYRVEEIKERFPWKKKSDWMPKDMPWPIPGKELIFTYRLGDEAIRILAERSNQDSQRKVLFTDDFKKLQPEWKLTESKAHNRNSFVNEGKMGEIMALSNTAVYAEQDFQNGTKVILARITPGTDHSSSWGPGLGLVFDDKTVKLNVRPGEQKVGFFDGQNERSGFGIEKAQNVWLRLELKENQLEATVSINGMEWKKVGSYSLKAGETPRKVRIGKMDSKGGKHRPR